MSRIVEYLLGLFPIGCLLVGVSIARLWRKQRAPRGLMVPLTIGYVLMVVVTLPVINYLALGTLEWSFLPLDRIPEEAGAIIVLSGSMDPPDGVRREATLSSDTLHRCISASQVYLRGRHRPVLVSGGRVEGEESGPSCAQLMSDLLIKLGVEPSDLVIESASLSTRENVVECRKKLESLGIAEVILVTEATQMRRALACFRQQGIAVVPAACHHRATGFRCSIWEFLPSPTAADGVKDVIHEWIGLAWYRLRGWL
jgi:uncharacterized SAM-binding protein YcdF (DUF218 family)